MSELVTESKTASANAQQNPLTSLLVNILIPSLILTKFSEPEQLGPTVGLILALTFPLGYLIVEFIKIRQVSLMSILGFISIFLTGGISLMQLSAHWIAVKEAAIPSIIGVAIIGSMRTKFPLVKKMLYNDTVFNTQAIEAALAEKSSQELFEKLMLKSSWIIAASFFLSATLNYGLAKYLLQSEPGSAEFNIELGEMTALSWPVIVLPSMLVMILALWFLVAGIRKLTGLQMDKIFHNRT